MKLVFKSAEPIRPRKELKPFILGMATMLLIAVVGGSWVIWKHMSTRITTIPPEVVADASFPLYYPTKLPAGFSVNPNSFSVTNEAVTYTITYAKDSNLAVSLQPLPTNFDFQTFYEKSMQNANAVPTDIGVARIGPLNGIETASLITAKTWILITAPHGIDDTSLQTILEALKPVSANNP